MNPTKSLLIEDLVSLGAFGPGPILEFGGYSAVAVLGGTAILSCRADYLVARESGVDCRSTVAAVRAPVDTAIVHVQKSRDATWQDLAQAWTATTIGGRVAVAGTNAVGIRSVGKRLERELGLAPVVLANRRHGRVLQFERTRHTGPPPPVLGSILAAIDPVPGFTIDALPGVFASGRFDPGSRLLLESLATHPPARAPLRILDLGCGSGILGLWSALRWPEARVALLDADARAIASARLNAERMGVASRTTVAWWDVSEDLPAAAPCQADLVVTNPPFHSGVSVDLSVPRAMLRVACRQLAPGGELRLVANRSLPYERHLGSWEKIVEREGYKVLQTRSVRPFSGRHDGSL